MRVDAKQLEALKRFSRTPDGRVLHSVLAAELEVVVKMLMSSPVENVQRVQGRAVLLDEILSLLDNEVG